MHSLTNPGDSARLAAAYRHVGGPTAHPFNAESARQKAQRLEREQQEKQA
jgi:hypothetical protein